MTVLDWDLEYLKDAVKFVDEQLERLESEIEACVDPDGFGWYDRTEHVLGLGCVACQQYITTTCSIIGVSKKNAFDCGPNHRSGCSMALILNEAANYWKHSSEWIGGKNEEDTRRVLSEINVSLDQPYVLMDIFNELLAPFPKRFDRIVPFLVNWREELQRRYGSGGYITFSEE